MAKKSHVHLDVPIYSKNLAGRAGSHTIPGGSGPSTQGGKVPPKGHAKKVAIKGATSVFGGKVPGAKKGTGK